MPITEGKQRASRIPLDYYKHPDPLVRWKRRLTWGLAALTIVWIGSTFLFGAKGLLGQRRFSHGTVAVAHKPIENDCAGTGCAASRRIPRAAGPPAPRAVSAKETEAANSFDALVRSKMLRPSRSMRNRCELPSISAVKPSFVEFGQKKSPLL